jgi:hypothetical protein
VLDANVQNVSSVSKIHKIFDVKTLCLKAHAIDFTSQTKLFQIFIIKCLFVKKKYRSTLKKTFFQVSLCISIETVGVLFFFTGLETLSPRS